MSTRRSRNVQASLVGGCMALFAMAAQAGLIVSQDFNTDLTGIVTAGVTVDRTGPESAITSVGGGASLNIKDTSTTSNPEASVAFSVTEMNNQLKIVFDFYNDATGNGNAGFLLRGSGNSTAGIQLMLNKFDGSGMWNFSSANDAIGIVLSLDTWYRVEILTSAESAATKTFDLTVYAANGTSVVGSASGLAFRNNITSYDDVRWYYANATANQGGQFYVDNLSVQTIPEPASLGLILLGTGGVLLLRRIRKS